jgi:hypothetical protein
VILQERTVGKGEQDEAPGSTAMLEGPKAYLEVRLRRSVERRTEVIREQLMTMGPSKLTVPQIQGWSATQDSSSQP